MSIVDLLSKILEIVKNLLSPIGYVISFIVYIVMYVPNMLYEIFERLPGFVQYLFTVLLSLIIIILVSKFVQFIRNLVS